MSFDNFTNPFQDPADVPNTYHHHTKPTALSLNSEESSSI